MPDINADFDQRVVIHSVEMPWIASPAAGVERRMLDRIGDEVARATSIVRYEPDSAFPAHVHTGGEEFLVLEGVFQDEHGDWPAGSYVRNPPTSSHTPGSKPGCTIFVKLWQFDPADRRSVRLPPDVIEADMGVQPNSTKKSLLFKDDSETVTLESWPGSVEIGLDFGGGCELLVLSGTLEEGHDQLATGSWLRLPPGTKTTIKTGSGGCRFWCKTGHLRSIRSPD